MQSNHRIAFLEFHYSTIKTLLLCCFVTSSFRVIRVNVNCILTFWRQLHLIYFFMPRKCRAVNLCFQYHVVSILADVFQTPRSTHSFPLSFSFTHLGWPQRILFFHSSLSFASSNVTFGFLQILLPFGLSLLIPADFTSSILLSTYSSTLLCIFSDHLRLASLALFPNRTPRVQCCSAKHNPHSIKSCHTSSWGNANSRLSTIDSITHHNNVYSTSCWTAVRKQLHTTPVLLQSIEAHKNK